MPHRCHRFDDEEAHSRALGLLAEIAGPDCADNVAWDPDHHLQGHVDVGGEHLVLIAPRDDEHVPLLLAERDWDALRHGDLAAV